MWYRGAKNAKSSISIFTNQAKNCCYKGSEFGVGILGQCENTGVSVAQPLRVDGNEVRGLHTARSCRNVCPIVSSLYFILRVMVSRSRVFISFDLRSTCNDIENQ